jgi:hypothetical protein
MTGITTAMLLLCAGATCAKPRAAYSCGGNPGNTTAPCQQQCQAPSAGLKIRSTANQWALVVNPYGGTPTPTPAPTPAAIPTPTPTPPSPGGTTKPVTISNGGAATSNWTASSDQPWLTISPSSGSNGPTAASVRADPAGLSNGRLTAHITVSASGVTATPSVSTVSMQVGVPAGAR